MPSGGTGYHCSSNVTIPLIATTMVDTPIETVIINLSEECELNADELAFFKAQTKIQDDEELKNHIAAVRDKAFKIHPYPCIKRMGYVMTTEA
jgi:hypothetical protein